MSYPRGGRPCGKSKVFITRQRPAETQNIPFLPENVYKHCYQLIKPVTLQKMPTSPGLCFHNLQMHFIRPEGSPPLFLKATLDFFFFLTVTTLCGETSHLKHLVLQGGGILSDMIYSLFHENKDS